MLELLYNKSRKNKVLEKVRTANSAWKKFKGLMLEKPENFDFALVFPFLRNERVGASLHMLFVSFPICVLFLNSEKKVLEKAILQPWLLNFTPRQACRFVIEMPVQRAENVQVGDFLDW